MQAHKLQTLTIIQEYSSNGHISQIQCQKAKEHRKPVIVAMGCIHTHINIIITLSMLECMVQTLQPVIVVTGCIRTYTHIYIIIMQSLRECKVQTLKPPVTVVTGCIHTYTHTHNYHAVFA